MRKQIILQTSIQSFLAAHRNYTLGKSRLMVKEVQDASCTINQLFPVGVDESEWEKWTGVMATLHLRLTTKEGQDAMQITRSYSVENYYFKIESYDSTREEFVIQIENDTIPVTTI